MLVWEREIMVCGGNVYAVDESSFRRRGMSLCPNSLNDKDPGSRRGLCDPAGIRTQGPYIKSVLLYQLSYRIKTPSTRVFCDLRARR